MSQPLMTIEPLQGAPIEILRCSIYAGHSFWAEIYLTERGQFTSQSDYGTHSYWWGSPGPGRPGDSKLAAFVRFLLGMEKDPHYFEKCFARGRDSRFDGEETLRAIKRHIIECRRGGWRKERAREEWDLIADGIDNEVDFANWLERTSMDDAWEFGQSKIPSLDVRHFIQRVLIPTLLPALHGWLEGQQSAGDPCPT